MDFWKELWSLVFKGLTWLTYNYPKFARRILYTLFACCCFMLAGLLIYSCGYKNALTQISARLIQNSSRPGTAKGKGKDLDRRITATLHNSSLRLDNAIKRYIYYTSMTGVILFVLISFCYCVERAKQSDR